MIEWDTTSNFFKQKEIEKIFLLKQQLIDKSFHIEIGFNDEKNKFIHLSQFFYEKIKALFCHNLNSTKLEDNIETETISNPMIILEKNRQIQTRLFLNTIPTKKIISAEEQYFSFFKILFVHEMDTKKKENFFRIILVSNKLTKQYLYYVIHSMFLFVFDMYKSRGINIV